MRTSFIACPVNAFQSAVSPTAYKVFLVLKSFDGKDHRIFPSKKTLAQRCGLGLTSIYKAIRQLVKAGLVTVVSRFDPNGRQTSNFYQINETPENWFAVDKEAVSGLLSSVELKVYSCLASHADANDKEQIRDLLTKANENEEKRYITLPKKGKAMLKVKPVNLWIDGLFCFIFHLAQILQYLLSDS